MFVRATLIATALLVPGLAAAQAAKPTDPQIAHIAYTAGQIDIDAARLALKKSHNAKVIAFARDMERDHKAVNDKALALVKKLNVTPQDNPTSQSLAKAADAKHKALEALDGAAFDKAYVDNEVAYHQTVNAALQDTLIPDATNADLKVLLQTGLKLFQSHQAHAEMLDGELK
jgi:putative membrane protein